MVVISETVESPDLDRAIHDQYTAMIKCLDELTALGYQSIGLVLEEALDVRVNGKWTPDPHWRGVQLLLHQHLRGHRFCISRIQRCLRRAPPGAPAPRRSIVAPSQRPIYVPETLPNGQKVQAVTGA